MHSNALVLIRELRNWWTSFSWNMRLYLLLLNRGVTILIVNRKLIKLTLWSRPWKSKMELTIQTRPQGHNWYVCKEGRKHTDDTACCSGGKLPLMPSWDYKILALILLSVTVFGGHGLKAADRRQISVGTHERRSACMNCSRMWLWARGQCDAVSQDI